MRRKEKLIKNEFYHVYNRGVEKRQIFGHSVDFLRFKRSLYHYLVSDKKFTDENPDLENISEKTLNESLKGGFQKLVELVCFCLMPNHFHLLIKQLRENGVSDYIQRIATSYTKYFNLKNERVGPLFQGRFKAKRVESEEQLIYLTKYIHRNPFKDPSVGAEKTLERKFLDYPWSSLPNYLRKNPGGQLLLTEPILINFSSPKDYSNFVFEKFDEKQTEQLLSFDIEADQCLYH